jgi:glycosyltransferase involved in cell wall biosynthesis
MKILVICQHYWPEPYPLTDICEELVKRGHKVDVVTDVPNYPMGKTYHGYEHSNNRHEVHNGVGIFRTFTIPRHHNVIFRILNYYSYAISSTRFVKKLDGEYDVVFANQSSPVMMSSAAFKYAKLNKKKVVMYCMDLWPASLAAGGVSSTSLIYKYYNRVSAKIYCKADKILITSQMFREYLIKNHQVKKENISYLPQYAKSEFEISRIKTSISDSETIHLLFAGNIGTAQSIPTIIQAAELLRSSKIVWDIVGDGSELEHCQTLAKEKGLTNVVFWGRKASSEMPDIYMKADAFLITLTSDQNISMTLPGKMQTYMMAGKPIIGAANGEIPRVIQAAECGYCAKAGDAEGLANAVNEYLNCNLKDKLGDNGRKYYETNFSKESFFKSLIKEFKNNIYSD